MKKFFLSIITLAIISSCSNSKDQPADLKNIPVNEELMSLQLKNKYKDVYDNVWDYKDGLVAVLKDGKWGYIDTSGRIIVPLQYESPSQFTHGYVDVKQNGKVGLIDKTGKVIVPLQYDYIGNYHNGLFSVRNLQEKYGFIDSSGKVIIPFEYDAVDIGWFNNGVASVRKGNKNGAIDVNNKIVIPFEYQVLNDFSKGVSLAKKNDQYLIVDKTGKEIKVPGMNNYEGITIADENKLIVTNKATSKQGIIDFQGKIILPLQFKSITEFYKGYAIAENEKGKFLIDEKGKTTFEQTPFLNLNIIAENLFYGNTLTNDTMFLFDLTGKHTVTEGFENIIPMSNDILLVNKNGTAWYINYKGEKIANTQTFQ